MYAGISDHIIRLLAFIYLVLMPLSSALAEEGNYETATSRWTSYEDVAKWLKSNFVYNSGRLRVVIGRTKLSGPSGLLARKPEITYEQKSGYCADSANFARQALNKIKPAYKARFVFIKNQYGQPHHWVTGFVVDGKIMVMDYGAGPEWQAMIGLHGPYDALDQYAEYLRSLNIKNFSPEQVEWRQDFPGQED